VRASFFQNASRSRSTTVNDLATSSTPDLSRAVILVALPYRDEKDTSPAMSRSSERIKSVSVVETLRSDDLAITRSLNSAGPIILNADSLSPVGQTPQVLRLWCRRSRNPQQAKSHKSYRLDTRGLTSRSPTGTRVRRRRVPLEIWWRLPKHDG